MKRLILIISILTVLIISVFLVSAAESAAFSLESLNAAPNRIVSVPLKCDCGSLSAAVFEFTFDKNLLEFREAASDSDADIKCTSTDSGIKLVYYSYSGDIGADSILFSLKFKTLNTGKSDLSFTVSDCVDSNACPLSAGNCTGGYINTQNSSADSKINTVSSNDKSTGKGKPVKESSVKNTIAESGENNIENIGTVNSVTEKSNNISLLLYILIGTGLLIILFTGIKIGTSISEKKKKNKNKNK